jgi:hypothetical protein
MFLAALNFSLPNDKILKTLRVGGIKGVFVGVIRVSSVRNYEDERIKFSLDFSAFGDELSERNFDDGALLAFSA